MGAASGNARGFPDAPIGGEASLAWPTLGIIIRQTSSPCPSVSGGGPRTGVCTEPERKPKVLNEATWPVKGITAGYAPEG